MLSLSMLPHEIVSLLDEFLLRHLRLVAKRGAGIGRIQEIKSTANRSVGIKEGTDLAKMELQLLLKQYQLIQNKFDELHLKIDV